MNEKLYGYLWLEDGSEIDLEGQSKQEVLAQLSSPIKSIGAHELGEEAGVYVKYPGGKSKTLLSPEEVTAFLNEKEEGLEEDIQVSMDDVERKPDDIAKIAEKSDVVVKLDESEEGDSFQKQFDAGLKWKEIKVNNLVEGGTKVVQNTETGKYRLIGLKAGSLVNVYNSFNGTMERVLVRGIDAHGVEIDDDSDIEKYAKFDLEDSGHGLAARLILQENKNKTKIMNNTKEQKIKALTEAIELITKKKVVLGESVEKKELKEEMTTGDMAVGEGSVGGVMKNKPKSNLTESFRSLSDIAGKTLLADGNRMKFYFADDYVEVLAIHGSGQEDTVIATCHYDSEEVEDGLEEAANMENNNSAIRVENEDLMESKQSKRKKVIAENSYSELIEVRGRKVIKEAKEVIEPAASDNSIEMVNIDTPTLGNIMPNSVIKAIDGYVSQTLAEIDRATTDLRAVKKSITNTATASDESFTTQTERIAFLLKQLSRVQLYCSNTIKANRFDKGLLDRLLDQKTLQNEVK